MAIIKKSGDNRCWRGCEEIGTLLHYSWECKLVQLLWKTVWWFLKNLEIEIPFDPAIPLLGIYPKDYKLFHYKDTCTWMFTAELFTIAKTWNQSKCPSMIDWTGKMWHIYTMEYYTAIKNDETWMNLKTTILSKLTQKQKIKHHMFSLIGGYWIMRTHGHREGSIIHWGLLGKNSGGIVGGGELGRDRMGRNARYRWWGGRQQITLQCVYLCNNLACSSRVPQNLQGNLKKEVPLLTGAWAYCSYS